MISIRGLMDQLDDIRIFNRALSELEAQRLHFLESPGLKITKQPQSVHAAVGSSMSLDVNASGSGPLSYQWRKNAVDLPDTNATAYSVPHVNMEHAGVYDVIITDAFGQTLDSQPATVEIGLAPAITQQPLDINATMGSNVLFSMEANGTQPLTYQWQKRDSNSSVFVDIPGAQAPALSFTGVDLNRIGAYRATVTNPYGQATTQFAQLNVGQAPVITKDVHDLFAAEGSTTGWTIEVNGTAPFTYRWRKDNQDLKALMDPH